MPRRPQPPPPDPLEVELLGEMVYCWKCREWWPADSEFFPLDKRIGRHRSPCHACIAEKRRQLQTLPCAVPGCDQPRAHWRYARCEQHLLALKVEYRKNHETEDGIEHQPCAAG